MEWVYGVGSRKRANYNLVVKKVPEEKKNDWLGAGTRITENVVPVAHQVPSLSTACF